MAPRPPKAAPSGQQAYLPNVPNPQAYLSTPLRTLRLSEDAALMSAVLRNGTRSSATGCQSPILPLQTYIIRNNSTIYDRGENTIFAPPAFAPVGGNFFDACTPLYKAKITRDGSILGYMIRDAVTDKQLLKVHFHGDTTNKFSRAFKAFVRSPVPKWDVENFGLFEDVRDGTNLGLIQEVFPDNRVFFPVQSFVGVPRLEMQVAATLGTAYYLAVTDVPEPVGEVASDILGRFAPRSETYTMKLKNCTREEAVLWLTMVIATDMKRRKSQNVQYGRSLLPVYI